MSIEEQLVSEIKLIVARGDIHGLQQVWKEYVYETDFGRELAWDFIFQKIYLHAALKKQKEICKWLDSIFTQLNPIQQITIRQMFPYAHSLLNRN
jgi:hypothetical protein